MFGKPKLSDTRKKEIRDLLRARREEYYGLQSDLTLGYISQEQFEERRDKIIEELYALEFEITGKIEK